MPNEPGPHNPGCQTAVIAFLVVAGFLALDAVVYVLRIAGH